MENASDVECRRKKKVLRWRRQVMKNAKEEETEDPEIEEERELCRNLSSTWIFFYTSVYHHLQLEWQRVELESWDVNLLNSFANLTTN